VRWRAVTLILPGLTTCSFPVSEISAFSASKGPGGKRIDALGVGLLAGRVRIGFQPPRGGGRIGTKYSMTALARLVEPVAEAGVAGSANG